MLQTKEQLIERVKLLLELPGVCDTLKSDLIINRCNNLTFEQLCEVLVFLRIRVASLKKLASSPTKLIALNKSLDNLTNIINKYDKQHGTD